MTVGEERGRRLAWEGCLNVRDLGGYPTAGGGETRWGAIVRADNLAQLTDDGRAALIDYGIRTIVDLRKPEEIALHPNPFAEAGTHGIEYRNISLVDPAAPSPGFTTLANDYKGMLDRFQPTMGEIMTAIARSPVGGVLIHCMAGKDRTGIVSALLLALAGVPRETIAADYALTAECLRPVDEEFLRNGPGDRATREAQVATFSPRAEVMCEVLEHLDERHGGVERYLRQAGLTAEDIDSLRVRLAPSTP